MMIIGWGLAFYEVVWVMRRMDGFGEVILADQTEGTLKVFGEIFPLGSGERF